jgi:hypothetical protein
MQGMWLCNAGTTRPLRFRFVDRENATDGVLRPPDGIQSRPSDGSSVRRTEGTEAPSRPNSVRRTGASVRRTEPGGTELRSRGRSFRPPGGASVHRTELDPVRRVHADGIFRPPILSGWHFAGSQYCTTALPTFFFFCESSFLF